MRFKKLVVTSFVFVFTIAMFSSLAYSAQQEREAAKQDREQMGKKIRDRISILRMWKMAEYLDLDEETGMKLFSQIKKFDKRQMQINKNRLELLKQLGNTLKNEKTTDGEMLQYANDLENLMQKQHELAFRRLAAVKKILAPKQYIKYIIFEARFKREIARLTRESLRRAPRSLRDQRAPRSRRMQSIPDSPEKPDEM